MIDETTNQSALVEDNAADYISEIQNLRANSVSRDDYNKLREENKRLISSLAKGETIDKPAPKPDINELRKRVFDNEHQSNLEYWGAVLELRDAVIDSGAPDPFLPQGHKVVPTTEDFECANRVAAVVKECIDYADGDSQLFTNELMRRTVEVAPTNRRNYY